MTTLAKQLGMNPADLSNDDIKTLVNMGRVPWNWKLVVPVTGSNRGIVTTDYAELIAYVMVMLACGQETVTIRLLEEETCDV